MAKFNVYVSNGLAPLPGNDYPLMQGKDIVLDRNNEDERLTDSWAKLIARIATLENKKPPYIGENGNWFIEDEDTGIPASPNLEGYATKDYVQQEIDDIEHNIEWGVL